MSKRVNVYLDNESEVLWNDMFNNSEKTASGWVKIKLNEEKGGAKDPFLLMKRMEEIKYQLLALDAEQKLLSNQLEAIKQRQRKKGEDKVAVSDPRKVIVLANTIKSLWQVSESKAKEFAEEYLDIDCDKRPEIQNFMQLKMQELEITE